MKILSIKGENIASLPHFDIDFTQPPLNEAGIFAITGKTGAGKSTILDALCVALFDKTPRLEKAQTSVNINGVQQKDTRNLLRRGTGKGMVEVVFLGQDSQKYRARWQVWRAHEKPNGNLQESEHLLYLFGEENPITRSKTETKNRIRQVLGLQFEQFTRAVLLAQGDFTAFLKAGRNEKSALLEKLTGTEIYASISQNIYLKTQEATAEYQRLQDRAGEYRLLSEEEVAELQQHISEVQASVSKLQEEQERIKKEQQQQQALIKQYQAVEEAEKRLQRLQEQWEQAQGRKSFLQKLEQVQKARGFFQKLEELQQQEQALKAKIQEQRQQIALNREAQEKAQSSKTKAQEALKSTREAQEKATPQLQEAQTLDHQLRFIREKLEERGKSSQKAQNLLKKQEEEWKAQQANLTQASADREQARIWLKEREPKKPIAENFQTIEAQLGSAQQQLEEQKRLAQQEKKLGQSLEKGKQELKQASENLEKIRQQRRQFSTQTEECRQKAQKLDLNHLRERLDKQQQALALTDKSISQYDALADQQAEVEKQQEKQAEISRNIEVKRQELQKLETALPQQRAEEETLAKQLREAELATAQNVEDLRSGLEEEKPCPVCGSVHHPYSQGETPPSRQHLDQLKKQWEEKSNELQEKESHIRALKELIPLREQEGAQVQQELNEALSRRSELREAWQTSPFAHQVPEQELPSAWLSKQKDKLEKELASIREQEQQGRKLQEAWEVLRQQLETATEEENRQSQALTTLQARVEQEQYQHEQLLKQAKTAKEALDTCQNSLQPFFEASTRWFENWQRDPQGFISRARKFAENWNAKQQQLSDRELEVQQLTQSLETAARDKKQAQEQAYQEQEAYQKIQKELSQERQKRNQLFEGKSVETVQQQWKRQLEQAQDQVDQASGQLQRAEVRLKEAQTELKATEGQQEQTQKSQKEAQQALEKWQKQQEHTIAQLSRAELAELLDYSEDFIKEEKRFFEELKEWEVSQKATLKERKQVLESLPKVPIDEEALAETRRKLEERKKAHEELQGQLQESQFKLKEHEQNQSRLAELQAEKQAAKENAEYWEQLDQLLGSSDGAKFQRYMQGYALNILLNYANAQLQFLAPRYRLETNADITTLGLQVIDRDMGDEPRSVYNLSGGETFLVSLALALGLSAFSSNQMNVESLFIDEGFGTLDTETLGIAMEALERLQSQGRKVGVISHVQEMMERIPVQVSVKKMTGGESRVEIMG